MRVILLADVPKVGNRHEIKNLKDGFAQNVLIARGLAVLATPKALAELESKKVEINKKKEEETKTFSSLIATVDNKTVTIKAKANDKGHLFKAINPHDVVKAIKENSGIEIDEQAIVMDHIKSIGSHNIIVRKGNKEGKCEVIVVAE